MDGINNVQLRTINFSVILAKYSQNIRKIFAKYRQNMYSQTGNLQDNAF